MAYERDYTAFASAVFGGASGNADIEDTTGDFSAAAFQWSFSEAPGSTPVILLSNAAAGNEGISATFDPTVTDPFSGEITGATVIVPQIDEATLEVLNFNGAADLVLVHTLYVTPAGGSKTVHSFGTFTVKQGAPS